MGFVRHLKKARLVIPDAAVYVSNPGAPVGRDDFAIILIGCLVALSLLSLLLLGFAFSLALLVCSPFLLPMRASRGLVCLSSVSWVS